MTDVRLGGRVQTGLAGLVVAVIVVFVVAALATGPADAANLAMAVPAARGARTRRGALASAGAFAIGLVQVSYAYSGWNGAAYIAGEVRDPVRALPRALVLGTGLVTVLYLALNVVFLCAVPPAALAGQINVAHIAAGALLRRARRGRRVVADRADERRLRERDGDVGPARRGRDGRGRRVLPRARPHQRARRADARRRPAGGARDRRGVDRDVRPDSWSTSASR